MRKTFYYLSWVVSTIGMGPAFFIFLMGIMFNDHNVVRVGPWWVWTIWILSIIGVFTLKEKDDG